MGKISKYRRTLSRRYRLKIEALEQQMLRLKGDAIESAERELAAITRLDRIRDRLLRFNEATIILADEANAGIDRDAYRVAVRDLQKWGAKDLPRDFYQMPVESLVHFTFAVNHDAAMRAMIFRCRAIKPDGTRHDVGYALTETALKLMRDPRWMADDIGRRFGSSLYDKLCVAQSAVAGAKAT